MPDERRYLQSKMRKKTCHPKFEETYVFQVSHRALEERVLKLTVLDVDRHKRHQVIGHALYPLREHDCENNVRLVIWRDLEREVSEVVLSDVGLGGVGLAEVWFGEVMLGDVVLGDVVLGDVGLDDVVMGDVVLGDVGLNDVVLVDVGFGDVVLGDVGRSAIYRNVQIIFLSFSTDDAYVKISLMIQNKPVKAKKTELVKKSPSPNFNESFTFKVTNSCLDTASLNISVMQHNTGSKDKQLGRIVLGSFMFARNKELDHWNEMIANQREQILHWHTLS
ncbi:Synaptotagmin-15 [Bulinus truncatus]|nr:Synaptotagmin-15 [Bulinus truncatus]